MKNRILLYHKAIKNLFIGFFIWILLVWKNCIIDLKWII